MKQYRLLEDPRHLVYILHRKQCAGYSFYNSGRNGERKKPLIGNISITRGLCLNQYIHAAIGIFLNIKILIMMRWSWIFTISSTIMVFSVHLWCPGPSPAFQGMYCVSCAIFGTSYLQGFDYYKVLLFILFTRC